MKVHPMKLNKKPLLAIIPFGTCNDISNTLGLSKNIKKSMDIILDGNRGFIDLGKINERFFIYGVACGSLSDVSYNVSTKLKKRLFL